MGPLPLLWLAVSLAGAEEPPALTVKATQEVARRLLAASRYRGEVRLRYYAPGVRSEDFDGAPVVGVPKHLLNASAGSIAPRLDKNPLDSAVIYWTPRFYAYAKTLDEVAFIMAHEVAHLELEHGPRYVEAYCAMYRAWKKKKAAPCVMDPPDYKRFASEMAAPRERLKLLARASEYEADQRAMRLASAAGYDARVYATLFARADAFWREPGFVRTELHPEPADRMKHLEVTALPEVLADQAAW
ncbi:MAG: M48 family metalloprotease [Elusimicrobiota bacterium]|nr:M48 family metalloprotease [Elusimicrobiota bacterium]